MQTFCNAKTRQGTPCKHQAGWGTDHVGDGRCKMHGGNAGAPIKHGRYSVKHRQSLADKVSHFESDPAPYELDGELAMMRAIFDDYLSRFADGIPLPGHDVDRLMKMLESVSRQVERIMKIMNDTALTQAELLYIKSRMADELPNYISDTDDQIALVRAVFGTFGNRQRVGTNITTG